MSRQATIKQWQQILSKWPVDRLRPETQGFRALIQKRIEAAPKHGQNEQREIDAAEMLLNNNFKTQYPPAPRILKPASKPTYYEDLARELEAIPDRSWVGNLMNRWSRMIRWK